MLAAGLLVACAGQEPPAGRQLEVRLTDFEVRTGAPTVTPGLYVLQLHNAGPTVHELVVARMAQPGAAVSFDLTGLLVDEDAVDVVAADESIEFRAVDPLPLELAAGEYLLFCNIEGHYRSGMFTRLSVQPAAAGQ